MSPPPITNNIRRLRFEHDEMTQQDLATHCDVTRQTILALEANRYSPSLALAFRIAQAFDRPLEEVFTWQGRPLKSARDRAST